MKSPYLIALHELPISKTMDIPGTLIADALSGLVQRDALEAPPDDPNAGAGTFQFDASADGDTVIVRATLKGHMHVACSACVTDVRLPIDETILATFMPKGALPADAVDGDEDIEVTADELDVFEYENEQIDLEPLIREQYILGVPYAPLCKEDCKGLCAQCGTDQNTGTCTCVLQGDPRFSPLSGLKLPS